MHKRALSFAALVVLALPATLLRADTVGVEKFSYDGTVNGIRNGKLSMTLKSSYTEILFDLNQINSIDLDATPKFAEAEQARADDPKKAAALYKQAIAAINKPELKLLAEWRAIEPTDKDGRWSEALGLFLDVYLASPTDAVWKGKPTHWPEAGSRILADGIQKIDAAIKNTKSDDVRKTLKTYLVEIYLKDGDDDAAGRLSKEIQTGIAEETTPAPVAAAGSPAAAADDLLQKKDFAGALKEATRLLDGGAEGEVAVRLFAVEAQAYEALDKPDDACAAWLRIAAHYPSSASAPAALKRAADLQKKLNRPDAAAALEKEIRDAYPNSPQAAAMKKP